MGIGAAFATGLVKGFSDNIDREQARRDKERDRLAGYEDAIAKAMMEETPNYAGINAVRKMVTKARSQMDSLEPIGPFGKRGRDVVMDLTSLQSSLANVGDNNFINIGSYKVGVSDDIAFRLKRDRSDPSKKSMLTIDALNEHLNDPDNRNAFLKQFEGNVTNLNELRGIYVPAVQGIIAKLQQENKGKPVDPRNAVTNYSFFSDLLGLGIDGQEQISINGVKRGALPILNKGLTPDDEQIVDMTGVTVLSSSLYPDVQSDSGYQAVPITTFTENDIDIGLVDMVAKSQGRSRDIFLATFSSQYNSYADFMTGLRHATNIAGMAQQGEKLSFSNNETLIRVGKYLDTTEGLRTDAIGQTKIIQGLMGSVLTAGERRSLANGTSTMDTYRRGTNAEEAYKMTFGEGNSFSDFKQRVRSAQIAKEQLNVYKDIVGNEINTVKGTILDSALKGINQFFGIGGTASQITSLLGTMDVEEEKRISARLENIKSIGGARARRDTLAFIIAANMARAEDQGGRLSDGDIQRNLDKLAPGGTTKPGELQSIETVIETVNQQLRLLQKYDNIIEIEGARGFSVATQEKVQALKTRDLALKRSRDSGVKVVDQMSFDEAKALETSTLYPAKNANHSVKTDGKGTFVVIDTVENKVIGQGLVKDLTNNGLIGRANPVNKPTSPASANIETEAPKAKNLVDDAAKKSLEDKKVIRGVDLESAPAMQGAFYIIDGKKYRKDIVNGEDTYTLVEEQGS